MTSAVNRESTGRGKQLGRWTKARDPARQRRLNQLEASSHRYVAFCGVVGFFAFFFLGWPTLVAWVGLAWAMNQFVKAMCGGQARAGSSQSKQSHRSHCRCRGCRQR